MRVQPFALLGASVVNKVASCLAGAVETWRSEWGLENLPASVECIRAWEASPQHRNVLQWQLRYAAHGKCAWIAWQPELARFIQHQMFLFERQHLMQSQSTPAIATGAAEEAVRALTGRIACAMSFQGDLASGTEDMPGPQENIFAIASGALLVLISIGEQTVGCLLDHDCVHAVAGSVPHPMADPIQRTELNKSLGKIPVSFPVEIGQAEVEVGSLLTLAVGDVIRLTASVDKPLTVHGPGQQALFDAYLGTLEGNIAVEVVRRGN